MAARPLRHVFAELAGEAGASADLAPTEVLAAHGHPDLPDSLVAEAVVNYADTAPFEVAEHLAPYVMANSAVPADVNEVDPAGWLAVLATAPAGPDIDAELIGPLADRPPGGELDQAGATPDQADVAAVGSAEPAWADHPPMADDRAEPDEHDLSFGAGVPATATESRAAGSDQPEPAGQLAEPDIDDGTPTQLTGPDERGSRLGNGGAADEGAGDHDNPADEFWL